MRVKPWGIGLFLVLGIGLFTAALFVIGDRHKTFSRHLTVYSEFSNLSGLGAGAKVRVSGFDGGELKNIEIPSTASAKFRLRLQIEKQLGGMVRQDSVVSIETDGVVGDKFVSVKKGTDQAEEAKDGSTLPSKEAVEIGALIEKGSVLLNDLQATISDVRGRVDSALDSVTRTANHTDGLVASVQPGVKAIVKYGTEITGQINTLVADVGDGKGAAGLLLRDDATKKQLESTLANVEEASKRLDSASERVNKMLAEFQSRNLVANAQLSLDNIQSLSRELNVSVKGVFNEDNMGNDGATNLRQTFSNLNRSTTNLSEDTEALKHNLFFRSFFKKRGFYNLDNVTPAEYRKACARQTDAGTRMWLEAATFQAKDSAGEEELSADGRLQINRQVSQVVETLPEYVVIVEGYSRNGSPDQRFVIARRRADLIRLYLGAHFHLRHSDIGIVPLLGEPPQGSGRDSWDGAAIMLLKVLARK